MTQKLRPEFQRVIELQNETDLDTVREGGFYLVQYPTHAPEVDSSYVLTVYSTRIGGRRKTLQVAMDVFTGVTSYRVDAGNWSEYGSGGGGASDAEDVTYDNGDSGLTATNLQEAVDELKELFDTASNITNLSVTRDATSVTVANSSGDDAVIPVATTSLAGVLSGADKTKLDSVASGAQANVPTNLSVSRDGSTVTVASNTGDDATLPTVTTSLAGVMSATDKVKLNSIEANATADMTGAEIVSAITAQLGSSTWQGGTPSGADIVAAIDDELGSDDWQTGGAAQNLSKTNNTTTVTVSIDQGGTSAVLTAADGSNAGVMSAAQATKLAGIETGATGDQSGEEIVDAIDLELGSTSWRDTTPTNLGVSRNASQVVVTNTAGDDATIPSADGSNAGILTASDKTKLDGIEAGAEANVPTDLGVSHSEDDVEITSSTGTSAFIQLAGGGLAGLMTSNQAVAIDDNTTAITTLTEQNEEIIRDLETRSVLKVLCATTVDIDIDTELVVANGIDGRWLDVSDLVLVKNQSTASENGIYLITEGTPERFSWETSPMHTGLPGLIISVRSGDANGGTVWTCTNEDSISFGSTPITFAPLVSGGSGNLSDDTYANLTAGFSATAYDLGTKSSGTLEVDPEDGNYQRVINNGAFQLDAPTHANDYQILLAIENDSSAGTITPAGFDLVDGNAFTTTDNEVFFAQITKLNGVVTLTVKNVTTPSTGEGGDAESITYDNAGSGLTATTVQDAIDELDTKLDSIETGADVTDATNVNAAGAVMESDYNANTILAATTDNTPVPLTVGASTFVGRKATGDISAMSTAEANTLLGTTNAVKSDTTANFTKGYTTTAYDLGTLSSGTTTLDVTNGQYQKAVCNGAITIEPPTASGAYSMLLEITMGASAGAITMDGSWNEINGVDFTTALGDVFYVQILKFEDFVQATITQVGSGGGGSGNLSDDTYANLTAGFSATAYNLGTKSSGNLEVDPEDGNFQRVINNGAFTLDAPTHANDYQILLIIENDSSAGAITPDGFTLVDGNEFTTTDNEIFFAQITKLNGTTTLTVKNVTTPSTGEGGDADSVTYDNAGSGLTATTVQDAIDELDTKLDTIETGADVTDATNVNAAGAVMESDYNANTILAATTDNTPVPLTVGASTFVGRKATGDISAMSASEARTILNVENGATADMTGAEIVSAIDTQLGGSTWQGGGGGGSLVLVPPQGRLTVTSGTPIITANTTAQTTLYYTPWIGTFCPIYNGSAWEMYDWSSQLSLALNSNSGHTGYHQTGKNFDVFMAKVSSTYYFGTGPAWTSDSARSAALAMVKGLWVNNATMTLRHGSNSGDTVSVPANQATYLGTMRATADGQTGMLLMSTVDADPPSGGVYLGIWNAYNRQSQLLRVSRTGAYNYSTATWRSTEGDNNQRISFVKGFLSELDEGVATAGIIPQANNAYGAIGIGLNSTSAPSDDCLLNTVGVGTQSPTTPNYFASAHLSSRTPLGWNYMQALEYSHNGQNTRYDWYYSTAVPATKGGLHARIWC